MELRRSNEANEKRLKHMEQELSFPCRRSQ